MIRTILLALLVASPALAEITSAETDRSMALTLRFGNLLPGIDDQFTNVKPYQETFGSDGDTVFQLQYDGHIYAGFGALSVGGSIGYWSTEGKGLSVGNAEATDSTSFRIIPLQVQVTYRFDPFSDYFPLVPVLKAGIDYYAWEIFDGSDETAQFAPGKDAVGGTWGYHYTLGLHLLLDFFAPDMAADFSRDAGVENSYLTFDYEVSQIDDFGSADSFRMGSETFYFGLAIEL